MNVFYIIVYVTCPLSKWQIPVFASAGTCFLYSYFPGGSPVWDPSGGLVDFRPGLLARTLQYVLSDVLNLIE